MVGVTRRAVMFGAIVSTIPPASAREEVSKPKLVEQWMNAWMLTRRDPVGTLHVSRFREPVYFLTRPIGWKPKEPSSTLPEVTVPTGFVTDFASIPRIFWSLLKPDDEYTYPAIIHDYLYWVQTTSREVADEIFRSAMQDFEIPARTSASIYRAVRLAGGAAWNGNAALKARGEKRVLKRTPDHPAVRWKDWKRQPDVFE